MSQETIRVLELLDTALDQQAKDQKALDEALKAFCEEPATERVAATSSAD